MKERQTTTLTDEATLAPASLRLKISCLLGPGNGGYR